MNIKRAGRHGTAVALCGLCFGLSAIPASHGRSPLGLRSPEPVIIHLHGEDDPVRAPHDATGRLRRANIRSTGEELPTPAAESPGPSFLMRPDLLLASGTRSTST